MTEKRSVRHPGELRWETRLLAATTAVLLVFGIALVAIMLYRPAGLWPSPVRKRELEVAATPQ